MTDRQAVEGPHETLEIQNVVASTGIEHELDLHTVALDLDGADYDPDHFPGLVYRLDNHARATALIFRSGKIVCTGAESVEGVHEAIQTTFDALRDLGIQIENPDITVQNIVSSYDFGEMLNLNAVAIGLGLTNVEYEPEQFPGLVYRLIDPDVVMLLFSTGKAVITGATVPEEVKAAIEVTTSRLTDLNLLH